MSRARSVNLRLAAARNRGIPIEMANQPTEHCGADVAAKAIALFGFMGGCSRLSVDRGNEITGYRPASAKGLGRVKTLQRGFGIRHAAQRRYRPQALIAAISGLMPTMFITRVRL